MLGFMFQIWGSSDIENTQIVFNSESVNDLTPGVNTMTVPEINMSVEITRDRYLACDLSKSLLLHLKPLTFYSKMVGQILSHPV